MIPDKRGPGKRFWEMSKAEIDEWVEARGLAAWKEKVNADRREAPAVMESWPNPWAQSHWDIKRQNIMRNLAPKLAEQRQLEAGSNGKG